jgi:hypothetical protein
MLSYMSSDKDGRGLAMMMMATNEPRFVCQACGRTYRWQPELAGQLARCRCGQEIRVPQAPMPTAEEQDLIPLGPPSQTRQVDSEKPTRAAPTITPHHVMPLEYRRPGALAAEPPAADRWFPDRVKDLYLPATLIGLGVLVRLGYYLLWRGGASGIVSVLNNIALEMVVGSAVLLVAILIAGRLRRIDFGPLPVAVFKLFAVVLGPEGAALLAAPLFIWIPLAGGLIYWIIEFCLYFAFLGALFDLDQSDTWYCVMVAMVVRIALYFGLLAVM